MDDLVRLKTPTERRQGIQRELAFLERRKLYARRDYEEQLRKIAEQEKRLRKQLGKISKEEEKRHNDV